MSKDFTAIISEKSGRYQEWLSVMGTNEIPIESPISERGSASGVPDGLFYQMDLAELTEEQRARLIQHIAHRFGISEQEVASELDEVGCPILDEDVTIVVHSPQKWM